MTMEIPSTVFCGPEDAKIRRWQEYVLENKVSSGRHSKEGFSVDIQLEVCLIAFKQVATAIR